MGVAGGRGVLFVRSSVFECMVGKLVVLIRVADRGTTADDKDG